MFTTPKLLPSVVALGAMSASNIEFELSGRRRYRLAEKQSPYLFFVEKSDKVIAFLQEHGFIPMTSFHDHWRFPTYQDEPDIAIMVVDDISLIREAHELIISLNVADTAADPAHFENFWKLALTAVKERRKNAGAV